MEKEIRKFALQNAVRFQGSANPNAIVGRIMCNFPDARKDQKETMKIINKIVDEVNKLSPDQQTEELKKIAPDMLEENTPEKKQGLKPIPNAEKGKVVMRFAPSPSGPMHIGHAMTLGVITEYCRMYDGKLIIRIEDTNPENICMPAYDMIPDEADWLTGNNVKEYVIQSDRIPLYYEYVDKLIEKDAVYVCDCDPDEYKENLNKSIPCQCRDLPMPEQEKRWKKMLDGGYKQGDAVLRLKTDINNKNPAMRDFPLARINEAEHPRQGKKYRVWPLMNLSVFVDDIELGMTHILRGKDHADNAKRQEIMYDYLGLKAPYTFFQGRINFEGLQVSCSKTKKLISEGKYSGWDDIRLPFLSALRRRGYQPGALLKWASSMGASLTDKKVSGEEAFKNINAFNKGIIEPIAKRFFFVNDPVKITIENAPEMDIELDLHPDNIKGGRKLRTTKNFIITRDDYEKMKPDDIARLMDCLNYVHGQEDITFHSKDYDTYRDNKCSSIIHWLPDDEEQLVDAEVLMPDNTLITGKAEKTLGLLKIGDCIQFERFGFCRLDSIDDNKFKFWFTHK